MIYFWKIFLIIEYEYSLYNFFLTPGKEAHLKTRGPLHHELPPPPPTKNESTVLMGGLFLLEHNLDERTLERKSQ